MAWTTRRLCGACGIRARVQTGGFSRHDAERGEIRAAPSPFGDIALARKDVATSCHLSVTIEDALQGVTPVTRGKDLPAAMVSTICCRRFWA